MQPRFFLLLHPPSPEVTSLEVPSQGSRASLSPLDIFGASKSIHFRNLPGLQADLLLDIPFNYTPNRSPTSLATPQDPTQVGTFERFVPPAQAIYDCDRFPLPKYLSDLARTIISSDWKVFESMEGNPQTKVNDTVDWGDEVDYSGYEWFKDPPPPRPEVRC